MLGTEIPRQVAGLIEVIEDMIEVYDTFKDLRGLPEAFQELSKWLPLVEQTLREAKTPAKKVRSAEDANVLGTHLDSCEEKADKLREIFQKVARKSTEEYDASAYRSIAVKLGKHRAETLMIGILEDLAVLAAHHVFQPVMQKQVEPLNKARQELENVPPSLSDSDFDEQPGTANQYGDGNRQFNNFGAGMMKNVDGHYFEAKGDQNFGMIPPKESAGRKGA
jgi:N-terminal domain on NACHT_NTPase and P-loop NTPases